MEYIYTDSKYWVSLILDGEEDFSVTALNLYETETVVLYSGV